MVTFPYGWKIQVERKTSNKQQQKNLIYAIETESLEPTCILLVTDPPGSWYSKFKDIFVFTAERQGFPIMSSFVLHNSENTIQVSNGVHRLRTAKVL